MKPTEDLPGMSGKGVERVKIKKIENAIAKYETAKDKRCQASPDEIAAKQNLQKVLQEHRAQLPKDDTGASYYRSDDPPVDYVLEESMRRRKVAASNEGEE